MWASSASGTNVAIGALAPTVAAQPAFAMGVAGCGCRRDHADDNSRRVMNMDDSHQHTSTEGEHLFCPACGTIIPAIEELVEQQRNQIAELQIEVQALQAEITRKIVRNQRPALGQRTARRMASRRRADLPQSAARSAWHGHGRRSRRHDSRPLNPRASA
jgi:hypothetical protein